MIKRKTARSRLKRPSALSEWCRKNRHEPIPVQHQTLKQKLQGHFGYFGITGNYFSLLEFREARGRSGNNGCRGVAAMGSCRGQISPAWRSATRFRVPEWCTACSAAQRHEMTSRVRQCARPDQWEPRVSNHPGRPGPRSRLTPRSRSGSDPRRSH